MAIIIVSANLMQSLIDHTEPQQICATIKETQWALFFKKTIFILIIRKKYKPYLPTIACKVSLVCHQKIQLLTDLPTMECTQLLQGGLSSAYPLQVQRWLVAVIAIAGQFQ
jgi:hypothetical protein